MDLAELRAKTLIFDSEIANLFESLGVPEIKSLVEELTKKASSSEFWENPEEAKRVGGSLASAKGKLERFAELQILQKDLMACIELRQEADSVELEREAEDLVKRLSGLIDLLKIETYLGGEFDNHGALLTIRSGAGGDDATDFAEMLMRMYLRYCARSNESV